MGFNKYWAKQFAFPHGLGGKIATFIMNRINRPQYKAVEGFFNKENNGRVLDIGFGNGYLLKRLSKRFVAEYYGVEISKDMLKTAGKKCKKLSDNLILGSAQELPFENNYFDLIYSVNTVYFWTDLEKGLSEIFSKLKAGGRFINVFYDKKWLDKLSLSKYGFTKYNCGELKSITERQGFEVVLREIKKDKSYFIEAIKR